MKQISCAFNVSVDAARQQVMWSPRAWGAQSCAPWQFPHRIGPLKPWEHLLGFTYLRRCLPRIHLGKWGKSGSSAYPDVPPEFQVSKSCHGGPGCWGFPGSRASMLGPVWASSFLGNPRVGLHKQETGKEKLLTAGSSSLRQECQVKPLAFIYFWKTSSFKSG